MPTVHEAGYRFSCWVPESDTQLLDAIKAAMETREPRQSAPSGYVTIKRSRSQVVYQALRRGFGLDKPATEK
jgi:hypothetical protein